MSRRIACPHCGTQLNIPSELTGRRVVCPRCEKQFRFPLDGKRGNGDSPDGAVVTAPNPDLFPPSESPSSRAASARDTPHVRDQAPAQDIRTDAPPKHDAQNAPQTARFIQPDANATRVVLGADGRLPNLALATQEKRADAASASRTSNPWVLVTVLCVSVLMSVLLLVIDAPQPSRATGKVEARQKIESIFSSWNRTDISAREIRDLLASALQAYNRGDYKQEKEYCRQVLNLLNREDAPRYGGYSGEDETLKEAISELLR